MQPILPSFVPAYSLLSPLPRNFFLFQRPACIATQMIQPPFNEQCCPMIQRIELLKQQLTSSGHENRSAFHTTSSSNVLEKAGNGSKPEQKFDSIVIFKRKRMTDCTKRAHRGTRQKCNSVIPCHICGVNESSKWRSGPNGKKTLCNVSTRSLFYQYQFHLIFHNNWINIK